MSTPEEPTPKLRDHSMAWLFTDALGLFHLGRPYSGFLLLLCAVDALASQRNPGRGKSKARFRDFLKEKLPAHTRVENFNIRVPKADATLRLEEILHEYLRNPMIHEGAHLDFDRSDGCHVSIDWGTTAPSVKVDDERREVILGGEWIFNMVGGVVRDAMLEDLTLPSSGRG